VAIPEEYDDRFQYFMDHLNDCAPDGIISIDLSFLHSIGLLKCCDEKSNIAQSLTNYFHVVETSEKITLHNHKYLIWILPRVVDSVSTTYILISMVINDDLNLEVVFSTAGIYNSPRLILKILEYFIKEIEENETVIAKIR